MAPNTDPVPQPDAGLLKPQDQANAQPTDTKPRKVAVSKSSKKMTWEPYKYFNENFQMELKHYYTITDPRYGEVTLYKHKTNWETILAKSVTLYSKEEKDQSIKNVILRNELQHPLLLSLQHYSVTEPSWFQSCCSKSYKATTYYEYFPKTLRDVNALRKKRKIAYEIKDICQILYDVTEVGAFLQKRLFDHGLLRPEFIAYDLVGHYV